MITCDCFSHITKNDPNVTKKISQYGDFRAKATKIYEVEFHSHAMY